MKLRLSLFVLAGCHLVGVRADSSSSSLSSPLSPFVRGGATRAAWGAQPKKQKVTLRNSPPKQQQQSQQKEAKEAMDAFLTRDSRTTFIGTFALSDLGMRAFLSCCCLDVETNDDPGTMLHVTCTHSHSPVLDDFRSRLWYLDRSIGRDGRHCDCL